MSNRRLNQLFNRQNKKSRLSLLIASAGLLLFLVVSFTLPFNKGLFSKLFNRPNSHAAGNLSAVMAMSPSTQTVTVNVPFQVSLTINGGGQSFNAAAVTVTPSSNLTLQQLSMGDCGFTFVPSSDTPTTTKPSFQGAAILGGSSTSCTVYTLTVLPTSTGTGTITLSNGQVLSSVDSTNILGTLTSGSYTINSSSSSPSPSSSASPSPLPLTATMGFSPSTGTHNVGDTFNADLVINGGGQSFNAAAADISVSSNLSIQTLTEGSCGFTYVPSSDTPTVTKPSFRGAALLGSSSTGCTVYTLGLKALSAGVGTVTIANAQVLANPSAQNILASTQNGSYTIAAPTPTPTPTPIPTITPTSTPQPTVTPTPAPAACTGVNITAQPANNQVVGSAVTFTATSTSCPNPLYEFTETKQGGSEVVIANYGTANSVTWNTTGLTAGSYMIQALVKDASDTSTTAQTTGSLSYTLSLQPLTLGSFPSDMYLFGTVETINGTKSSLVTSLTVTNASGATVTNGYTITGATSFTLNLPLAFGTNNFNLVGLDASSNKTPSITISINRHHLGDIDGKVDSVTNTPVGMNDLALFAADYGKDTSQNGVTLSNPLSDLNGDGKVNLTDYSIFAREYGQPNPTI